MNPLFVSCQSISPLGPSCPVCRSLNIYSTENSWQIRICRVLSSHSASVEIQNKSSDKCRNVRSWASSVILRRRDKINNGALGTAALSSVMDIRDGLVCYKHMQILCIRVGWDGVGFSFRRAWWIQSDHYNISSWHP